jgi:hypothetical protein
VKIAEMTIMKLDFSYVITLKTILMKITILLMMSFLTSQFLSAQIITIKVKEFSTYEHPNNIPLYQAEREGVLKFKESGTTQSIDVVDLNNSTYTRTIGETVDFSAVITENIPDGNVFTIRIGKNLFILSNNVENGEYVFIVEYPDLEMPGVTYGEISMGSQLEVEIKK